jgi:hypothetical protein
MLTLSPRFLFSSILSHRVAISLILLLGTFLYPFKISALVNRPLTILKYSAEGNRYFVNPLSSSSTSSRIAPSGQSRLHVNRQRGYKRFNDKMSLFASNNEDEEPLINNGTKKEKVNSLWNKFKSFSEKISWPNFIVGSFVGVTATIFALLYPISIEIAQGVHLSSFFFFKRNINNYLLYL